MLFAICAGLCGSRVCTRCLTEARMPSRFVDLGSVHDDAVGMAAELASSAAQAVGGVVGGMGGLVGVRTRFVFDWVLNASGIEVSNGARMLLRNATLAVHVATADLTDRDKQTLLQSCLLLLVAAVLLLLRCMVMNSRVRRMVRFHVKLE